jgi:hypothetical protein
VDVSAGPPTPSQHLHKFLHKRGKRVAVVSGVAEETGAQAGGIVAFATAAAFVTVIVGKLDLGSVGIASVVSCFKVKSRQL